MPFEKGHKKTGGRAIGKKNKVTEETLDLLTTIEGKTKAELDVIWNELSAQDKMKTYIALLGYVRPKLQSISVDQTTKVVSSVTETLRQAVDDASII